MPWQLLSQRHHENGDPVFFRDGDVNRPMGGTEPIKQLCHRVVRQGWYEHVPTFRARDGLLAKALVARRIEDAVCYCQPLAIPVIHSATSSRFPPNAQ